MTIIILGSLFFFAFCIYIAHKYTSFCEWYVKNYNLKILMKSNKGDIIEIKGYNSMSLVAWDSNYVVLLEKNDYYLTEKEHFFEINSIEISNLTLLKRQKEEKINLIKQNFKDVYEN